jgi:hypothetical protein
MATQSIRTLLILAALAAGSLSVGCGGGGSCDLPLPVADLRLTVIPASIPTGSPETIVVSFERSVFTDGEFKVQDWDVHILDNPGRDWLGTYSDSLYGMANDAGPYLTGVILSGEIIDDRSIELVVEFPADTPAGAYPIEMIATNGGVECSTGAGGESTIVVTR